MRRPGVVTAAQVLLALSALAQGLVALLGLGTLALASSVSGSLPLDEADTADLAGIRAAIVLSVLYALASGVFAVWAARALGRRRTIARLLITLMPVLDAAVAIATMILMGAGAGEAVATLVFVVPLSATLIVLLWLPGTAKEWFGDPAGRAADRGGPGASATVPPSPVPPSPVPPSPVPRSPVAGVPPRGPVRLPTPHRAGPPSGGLPTPGPSPDRPAPAQPRVATPARGAPRPTPPAPAPTPGARHAAPDGRHAR